MTQPLDRLMAPTVFIVDDDAAVRDSLTFLVESISLPAKAYPAAQAFLDDLDPQRPGCLILDLRLPVMSGLQLQSHLRAEGCELPIIFISGHGDVPSAVRAMKDGAISFLEKPFRKQELIEEIQRALTADARARDRKERQRELRERLEQLTPREREVLREIGTGKPQKTIAADLGISRKTLDVHRANITRKLGASSPTDLVRLALHAEENGEEERVAGE